MESHRNLPSNLPPPSFLLLMLLVMSLFFSSWKIEPLRTEKLTFSPHVRWSVCQQGSNIIQWDISFPFGAGHKNQLPKSNRRAKKLISPLNQCIERDFVEGLRNHHEGARWKSNVMLSKETEAQTLPKAWGPWCSKINPPSQLTPHVKIPAGSRDLGLRCGRSGCRGPPDKPRSKAELTPVPQALAHRLMSD